MTATPVNPQAANGNAPPPAPHKRAGGRPAGSKNRPRTETPESDDPPESALAPFWKDSKNNEQDYFDWQSQFTTDDWQMLTAYLYRTAPTIDRRNSGRPISLRKYGSAFDKEQVLLDEGSGGYRIDLCLRDAVTGRSSRIGQHYFTILDMEKPPRVPPGDWIDDAENATWAWAKPALEAAANLRTAQVVNPGADPNKMFQTVLEGVRTLAPHQDSTGMNALLAQIIALSDPSKQIALFQTMIQQMKPADNGENFQKFLMAEYAALRAEVAQARSAKPPSLLDQMKELFPMAKELVGLFGGKVRAGVERTDWGDVVNTVVEKLSDNAPLIAAMWKGTPPPIESGFQLGAAKPAAAAAQPSDGTQPAAGAAPTTEGAQPAMSTDDEKRLKAMLAKWGTVLQSIAPFMIDQFRNDLTGYDFRDWFISRQTLGHYNSLRVDLSAQDMFNLIQSHPGLRSQFQPPDKLQVFLTEFYTEPGKEPAGAVPDQPQPTAEGNS